MMVKSVEHTSGTGMAEVGEVARIALVEMRISGSSGVNDGWKCVFGVGKGQQCLIMRLRAE